MLSVLIRAKNEEKNIGRAIRSVLGLSDEVIVLDDHSTDRTSEVAKSLGAKVYRLEEKMSYAEKLNYGIELCKNEWVMVIDADEEVSEELRESIRKELKNPRYEAYKIPRKTYYLGDFLNHVWYPEWRLRLFRKGRVFFEGEVHERAIVKGRAGKLKGDLYHYSFRSLKHQYEKNMNYAKMMAKAMKKRGERFRAYKLFLNPLWSFIKLYLLKLGFLDGCRGFLASLSVAIYTFQKYAFLFELELKEKYQGELWRRE
ncbi:glycosyltransferase family 2 protein [Aquifex pyrophilus]